LAACLTTFLNSSGVILGKATAIWMKDKRAVVAKSLNCIAKDWKYEKEENYGSGSLEET
jgi:hypothetical protein